VTGVGPGGVTIDRESPQKAVENHDHHGGMSKGAEAALITVTVLGLWLNRDQIPSADNEQAA
jgi:hypothetical protein